MIFFTVQQPVVHEGHFRADVLDMPLMPAFFLGVFGFVVAHRLTTSLRRTDELVSTVPVEQQRRTRSPLSSRAWSRQWRAWSG